MTSALKTAFASLCAFGAALSADADKPKPMPVGGQAVIEGVLMKGYKRWGLAVRKENGEIVTEHWRAKNWGQTRFGKIPIIRGFLNMIEMLGDGFHALSRSADIALGEDEEMTAKDIAITIIVAILLVGGLFIALPLFIGDWLTDIWGLGQLGRNIAEGCARGVVFIAYLAFIGLWGDMARILQYHGAEHKTINAYESGLPMSVESVMGCPRLHPRCGTSFLLIVVIVSIIVFSIAGRGGIIFRICLRILLIPVVVGVSYEFIRAMWKLGDAGRFIMVPAMSLQYLTTREPSKEQVEVGIRSLEVALDRTFIENTKGKN